MLSEKEAQEALKHLKKYAGSSTLWDSSYIMPDIEIMLSSIKDLHHLRREDARRNIIFIEQLKDELMHSNYGKINNEIKHLKKIAKGG